MLERRLALRDGPYPQWEVRPDDAGEFDEIVANGYSVHFEMLDENCLWVGFTRGDTTHHVTISARGKLKVNVNENC